jgi:hypothetical protein
MTGHGDASRRRRVIPPGALGPGPRPSHQAWAGVGRGRAPEGPGPSVTCRGDCPPVLTLSDSERGRDPSDCVPCLDPCAECA